MKRAIALAVAIACGCAPVVEQTKRERGSLLRTYERNAEKPPILTAHVQVRWPKMETSFTWRRLCGTETVREYQERVTTIRTAPASWPTIGIGGALTLAGAGLLAFRGSFSGTPHTNFIDASGRYGASDRTQATAWGITGLALGLPVLGLGIWERSRIGQTETPAVAT